MRASFIGVDENVTNRVVREFEQKLLEGYLYILLNLSSNNIITIYTCTWFDFCKLKITIL